jgi:membrane protein
LITEDKSYLSFWRNLKGIVIIGVTILLMVLSLSLPALFVFFVELAQENFIVNFIWDIAPALRPWIEYYQNYNLQQSFFLKSNVLHAILFISYFTFLYRWFFSWKVPLFNSLLAALTFVFSLLAGKNLFLLYVYYVRENLVRNYGDFYTAILALMWVYFVMCFFFFGACLCHVMRNEPLYDEVKGQLSRWLAKIKLGAS